MCDTTIKVYMEPFDIFDAMREFHTRMRGRACPLDRDGNPSERALYEIHAIASSLFRRASDDAYVRTGYVERDREIVIDARVGYDELTTRIEVP